MMRPTQLWTRGWPPSRRSADRDPEVTESLSLPSRFIRAPWYCLQSMRTFFSAFALLLVAGVFALAYWVTPHAAWAFLVVGPLVLVGTVDMLQTKHAIRRNFPIIGHGRYLFEMIRPEIYQYFIESNTDGKPFNRELRSVVYQRAKGELDTLPFGTQRDVYAERYEWLNHSMAPKPIPEEPPRIIIGEHTCKQPYAASLLNISAMSYGALSRTAIAALNQGARLGHFAHNTGEGGISEHHLQGGDLIWQLGTGYFGARAKDGTLDRARFADNAARDEVKMIEIKISQGAKPGHGGILPAAKVTPEIAWIRGVSLGHDVISPPAHTAFSTPKGLLELCAELRELSGGKPVGFKLCVGKRREFLAICKAMVETGLYPDYIAVDGAEGGTGAAPLEFSNSLGCPLTDALIFVHNALTGVDMRDRVRIFASGKVTTGFDMARLIALGADVCYAARSMMLALGCIQARRCNSNHCPAGVATQSPSLYKGLVVDQKAPRVARYHHETVHSLLELCAAAGLAGPHELRPWHIMRRLTPHETRHYGELFQYMERGALLADVVPASYQRAWRHASADTFAYVERAQSQPAGLTA